MRGRVALRAQERAVVAPSNGVLSRVELVGACLEALHQRSVVVIGVDAGLAELCLVAALFAFLVARVADSVLGEPVRWADAVASVRVRVVNFKRVQALARLLLGDEVEFRAIAGRAVAEGFAGKAPLGTRRAAEVRVLFVESKGRAGGYAGTVVQVLLVSGQGLHLALGALRIRHAVEAVRTAGHALVLVAEECADRAVGVAAVAVEVEAILA